MEDKMFPKYQYSVFLKNGRDEQIVIRANTFEELLEAKKNVNKILEKVEAKPEVTQSPTTQVNKPTMTVEQFENRTNCEKCGSAMGISRKGNKYCLKKCWLA